MASERTPDRDVAIETGITTDPIGRLDAFDDLSTHADGAVLVFQGRVRETNEGRKVSGLSYEAYGEMAEKELAAICGEAAASFEIGAVRAVHRVGDLELGDVAVVVGVAAPHRNACYEASRFVIEQVKVRLPVWKHERYADGETGWVGAPAVTKAASR
ncbi:MAG: molybdenum cofactor biosynthesis protein MoaE [Gemmatimonadota bacterium]|nr:molybdenum cofactor biosynthesis protein MoaE [Gemmatimonadota bacterium]